MPALCAAAWLGGAALAQTPRAANIIVIPGVRLLDAAGGRYLPPATVVIENGRITNIAPETPPGVPATATRVRVDGGVLVPGLIDAHAWAAPTADLDVDYSYLMGLAHGVTTYRVLNARTNWAVSQRARALSGSTLAPRLFTSGQGLDQGATPGRWLFDARDAAAAADEVTRQIAANVDWIAGYDDLGPDAYRAMTDATKDTAVRVSGQPGAASMLDLADARVASIETLAYPTKPRAGSSDDAWLAASANDLAALHTRLLRARVTLVPLMAAALARAYPDEVVDSPELALLPEARRTALADELKKLSKADIAKAQRAWTSQAAFLKRFVRAGGRVAAGSGFEWRGYPPPGIGVHLELAALVRAGLSPEDALRTATTYAADLLNAPKEIGRITTGIEANLVIVQGDPLKRIEDLRKITTVIRGGEVYDAKDLLARATQAMTTRPR